MLTLSKLNFWYKYGIQKYYETKWKQKKTAL